jgi:hypothetical protein
MSREFSGLFRDAVEIIRRIGELSLFTSKVEPAEPQSPQKRRALPSAPTTPEKLIKNLLCTPSPRSNGKGSAKASPAKSLVDVSLIQEKKEAFIDCLVRAVDLANLNPRLIFSEIDDQGRFSKPSFADAEPTETILVLLTYAYCLKAEIEELSHNRENISVNTPLQARYKSILAEQRPIYEQHLFHVDIFAESDDFFSRFENPEEKIKEFADTFLGTQHIIFAAFSKIPQVEICSLLQQELEISSDDAEALSVALLGWTSNASQTAPMPVSPTALPEHAPLCQSPAVNRRNNQSEPFGANVRKRLFSTVEDETSLIQGEPMPLESPAPSLAPAFMANAATWGASPR